MKRKKKFNEELELRRARAEIKQLLDKGHKPSIALLEVLEILDILAIPKRKERS